MVVTVSVIGITRQSTELSASLHCTALHCTSLHQHRMATHVRSAKKQQKRKLKRRLRRRQVKALRRALQEKEHVTAEEIKRLQLTLEGDRQRIVAEIEVLSRKKKKKNKKGRSNDNDNHDDDDKTASMSGDDGDSDDNGKGDKGCPGGKRSSSSLSMRKMAADTPPRQTLCPITLEVMSDPVLAADGHTYERQAFEEYLDYVYENDLKLLSPMTGLQLPCEDLIPNVAIRSLGLEWKERQRR